MITFKQFIAEALEHAYARKIEDAPDWGPSLSEKDYQVKGITFSSKHGMGAVPNNQNVHYMGLVALCKPSIFRKLAQNDRGSRETDASKITEYIKDGYSVGIPWLTLDTLPLEDGKGPARVVGHEGRARMIAIQKLIGDDPIPIHVFLGSGMRSRDLTPEIIKGLYAELQQQESTSTVLKPFTQIYVDGSPK